MEYKKAYEKAHNLALRDFVRTVLDGIWSELSIKTLEIAGPTLAMTTAAHIMLARPNSVDESPAI